MVLNLSATLIEIIPKTSRLQGHPFCPFSKEFYSFFHKLLTLAAAESNKAKYISSNILYP